MTSFTNPPIPPDEASKYLHVAGRPETRVSTRSEPFEVNRPRRFLTRYAIALVLSALVPIEFAAARESAELAGQTLVLALRAGGYNLYFRHAATDWSADDHVAAAGDWKSCDPQKMRQLSAVGRETARMVGEAMRALGIPVGRVLASPYCRTVETARTLNLGPVETTTDVMNLRVAEFFGGESAIVARARRRLAISPEPGTNNVFVAHGNVIKTATGEYPAEAEVILFYPDGSGGFSVRGRVLPQEWRRLAAASARLRGAD